MKQSGKPCSSPQGRTRSHSPLILLIPPLRERKEDIPLLIAHVIRNNPAFKEKRFNEDALSVLSDYSWPRNVRELQNVIYRTLLLSHREVIGSADLPMNMLADPRRASQRLADIERDHILGVLKEANGQKGKAAEILGIDPKTLYRKLLEYGVNRS